MASNKSKAQANLTGPASFPTRFRCKVGGEWKSLQEFSANQQKLVLTLKSSGRPVNAAHSGMTCLAHAPSSGRQELTCVLCGLAKPIDQFSKNSRKSDDPECKRCVAWTETQEPDVTPAPLETGHIAYEEKMGQAWSVEPDGHDSSVVGGASALTPLNAMSSLSLSNGDSSSRLYADSVTSGSKSAAWQGNESASSSMSMAPSLAKINAMSRTKGIESPRSMDSRSISGASSSAASERSFLPPHLRKLAGRSSGDGASISTATTMKQTGHEKASVLYNAWDAMGQHHELTKTFTDDTQSVGTDTSESKQSSYSDWPETSQPPLQLRNKGKGKWPKASELKMSAAELHRFGNEYPSAVHSASIDPGIDSQKAENWNSARPYDEDD